MTTVPMLPITIVNEAAIPLFLLKYKIGSAKLGIRSILWPIATIRRLLLLLLLSVESLNIDLYRSITEALYCAKMCNGIDPIAVASCFFALGVEHLI